MGSVKILLKKDKKRANGECPVALRITKDRKSRYIFIEWISESQWDSKKSRVKTSHPNSARLNNLLLRKLAEANDLLLEDETNKRSLSLDQIKNHLQGKGGRNCSFMEVADQFKRELEQTNQMNRWSTEKSRIKVIAEEFYKGDLSFYDIDVSFLRKLKAWLISNRGVSERTAMNYFVTIRTLFNRAITDGLIEQKYYPFGKGKIRIKYPQTIKIGLEESELRRIENLDLEEGSMIWHTRNVFLFSFYLAGVRISDVLRMKWDAIKDDRLYYSMGKNRKVDSLKIPKKVLEIISFYESQKESESDYIFPELKKANQKNPKDIHAKIKTASKKFNQYLERIAEQAKIEKKITNHIARHTFGNIAGDQISPQMLQKLYRHSNLSTTIGYQGNFIHKDADEALESVIGF